MEALATLCNICKANEAVMAVTEDSTDGRIMLRLGECLNQIHICGDHKRPTKHSRYAPLRRTL